MHHPKTLALKRVKIKQTRANQKVGLRTGAIQLLGDQRTLLKIFQEPPRNLNVDLTGLDLVSHGQMSGMCFSVLE